MPERQEHDNIWTGLRQSQSGAEQGALAHEKVSLGSVTTTINIIWLYVFMKAERENNATIINVLHATAFTTACPGHAWRLHTKHMSYIDDRFGPVGPGQDR